MDVMSINDGPVTVLLDTKEPKPTSSSTSTTPSSSTNASSTNLAALSVKKEKKQKKIGTLFDPAKRPTAVLVETPTTRLEEEADVVERKLEKLELAVDESEGGAAVGVRGKKEP